MMAAGVGPVEAFVLASVGFGVALALLSWAMERSPYPSIGGRLFVKDSDPVVGGSPFERTDEVAQMREALESLRSQRSQSIARGAPRRQTSRKGGNEDRN